MYQINLVANMRVHPQKAEFSKYLLTIGEGTAQLFFEIGDDMIKISNNFLVKMLPELIGKVFPDTQNGYRYKYYVAHWAILTPKNETVDRINVIVPWKKLCVQIC